MSSLAVIPPTTPPPFALPLSLPPGHFGGVIDLKLDWRELLHMFQESDGVVLSGKVHGGVKEVLPNAKQLVLDFCRDVSCVDACHPFGTWGTPRLHVHTRVWVAPEPSVKVEVEGEGFPRLATTLFAFLWGWGKVTCVVAPWGSILSGRRAVGVRVGGRGWSSVVRSNCSSRGSSSRGSVFLSLDCLWWSIFCLLLHHDLIEHFLLDQDLQLLLKFLCQLVQAVSSGGRESILGVSTPTGVGIYNFYGRF